MVGPRRAYGIPLAIASRMKRLALAAVLLAACGRDAAPEVDVAPRSVVEVQSAADATPDRLNVVTLGDSLAYGAGDESDNGIAGRLEAELERRGIGDVTMTNLGVNGAQTSDLIARLRQDRVRKAVAGADAIVLSIGANDLFRSPGARDQTLRAPLQVADRILSRIEEIVATLHKMNPDAEILILGGYNPVPNHSFATLINDYLRLWDETLADRFKENERVAVVRMADIVDPQRLSRHDNFHPGGEAYEKAAQRIAAMLLEELRTS